ncbi:MAG: phosphatase PAP2 family protein [Clostridia bacterium]|nr:phosphatase PAP2 family protein [Clostridia bacterium]
MSFDFSILYFIQDHLRCAFLDAVMPYITYLGEAGTIWFVAAIILLITKKYRKYGVMIVCAMALGYLTGEIILKGVVARPRPFSLDDTVALLIHAPSGFSFPSGHSVSSFAASAVICRADRRIGIPAIVLAALIAFSRLYLFVHFPTDVLAGILIGVFFGALTIIVGEAISRRAAGKKEAKKAG